MNNFNDILESDNPKFVETVSELRHFINVHGVIKKLLNYFKTDIDKIEKIVEYCYGKSLVKNLINDEEYLLEQIQHRNNENIAKHESFIKNQELIFQLKDKRLNFCGIGTNKIKRRLNKLSVDNKLAKLYRVALEIEDKNIQAKNSTFNYKEKIYEVKKKLIDELIHLSEEYPIIYGKQKSNIIDTTYIIYFEIPNCEQISFHTELSSPYKIPNYDKEWDKKINSTLIKLEKGILDSFKNINL